MLRLQWIKIVSLFRKMTIERLVDRIDNCIRTQILSTTPNVKHASHAQFKQDNALFQIKCFIELVNLYNFTLTIDFSDTSNVKYTYDVCIKDGDILVDTITEFNTKLNQQKKNINAWIAHYASSRR